MTVEDVKGSDSHPAGSSARVVMLGAGQLARMTHQAAVDYGISLHVLADHPTDPAVLAGASHTIGHAGSLPDIVKAAAHGDVVTLDHELVPLDHLRALADMGHAVRPNPEALTLTQDKLVARHTFDRLGDLRVAVPAFSEAATGADVESFAAVHGWPVVVKSRGGGYDGRGVHVIGDPAAARELMATSPSPGAPLWVVEEHLDLRAEFAILTARNPSGHVRSYPPIRTFQRDGICHELVMPSGLPEDLTDRATAVAESILAGIDATGICATEFFWTTDGRLLLNELALRPHNSGHATIEGCRTSQFHQHLRAVLDWPLGPTDLVSPVAMVNLIAGPDLVNPLDRLPVALASQEVHVHLYQKSPRPGRKIGHVTALAAHPDDALAAALAAADVLTRP